MIEHVGFPRCVCDKPFTLVNSPAEYRAWKLDNPEQTVSTEKSKAKKTEAKDES